VIDRGTPAASALGDAPHRVLARWPIRKGDRYDGHHHDRSNRASPDESDEEDRARRAGFYLPTFVTSIPALALYGSVHNPDYVIGPGPDTGVLWGGPSK
jgi:hypothetical protein